MMRSLASTVGFLLLLCASQPHVAFGQTSSLVPLRIACRAGQAPFNTIATAATKINGSLSAATTCEGYFAALWQDVTKRPSNFTYTYGVVDSDNIDVYLNKTLAAAAGVPYFDLIISFHTVTPARLLLYDFTQPITSNDYVIILKPKFAGGKATGLAPVVLRAPTLVVFGIIVAIGFFMTFLLFGVEGVMDRNTELHLLDQRWWKRLLTAFEQGFEIVVTGQTSIGVTNQIARSFRSLVGLLSVFLLALLGSVITSRLTQASISTFQLEITDVRNVRLAIASNNLVRLAQRAIPGLTVTTVSNIDTFAAKWYAELNDTPVDGMMIATPSADYVQRQFGNGLGCVVTKPFTASGSKDIRAMPVSRNAPPELLTVANLGLTNLRESGFAADLVAKYLKPAKVESLDDVPVPTPDYTVLYAVVCISYGLALLWALFLYIFGRKRRHAMKTEGDVEGDALVDHLTPVTAKSGLVWRGRYYPVVPEDLEGVLNGLTSSLIPEASEERAGGATQVAGGGGSKAIRGSAAPTFVDP